MNEFLKENVSVVEMGIRFLLGATLLAVIIVSSVVPSWLALIAIYPVITAIMAWDPIYAVAHALRIGVASNHREMDVIPVG